MRTTIRLLHTHNGLRFKSRNLTAIRFNSIISIDKISAQKMTVSVTERKTTIISDGWFFFIVSSCVAMATLHAGRTTNIISNIVQATILLSRIEEKHISLLFLLYQ